MTRTHSHSAGPAAAIHDRHLQRHGGDARGAPKKQGGGKHNWGTADEIQEELPLAREFGDSNYKSVTNEEELERASAEDLKRYEERVHVVSAEDFAREKGIDPETAKEVAREHPAA
ncbi:hypothetical protein SpCBS45565_g03320 [Spizellomyces sp. 'palustris']|nr:hypothetical protein SpCBS45565_g03320 [Spizellomyces sp. 'palustris']